MGFTPNSATDLEYEFICSNTFCASLSSPADCVIQLFKLQALQGSFLVCCC